MEFVFDLLEEFGEESFSTYRGGFVVKCGVMAFRCLGKSHLDQSHSDKN